MRDEPPPQLVDLLARLRLASVDQLQTVRGRVKRLARGLPLVESLWVDALGEAGVLTRFQVNEINSGRGEALLVGPYVLQKRLQCLSNAAFFLAADVETKRLVHLAVIRARDERASASPVIDESCKRAVEKLQAIVDRLRECTASGIAKLENAGCVNGSLWIAYEPTGGFPLIDWVSTQGRLSPTVVWEIARQSAAALAAAEACDVTHGGELATSVWLHEDGAIRITRLTFESAIGELNENRSRVQPVRDFADFLWHLFAGRPPITGRGKKLPDLKRIAPETPKELAELIERCSKETNPRLTFAEIAATLGPPTCAGRRKLVAALLRCRRVTLHAPWREQAHRASEQLGGVTLAVAACVLLMAAATSPLWRTRSTIDEPKVALQSAKSSVTSPIEPSVAHPRTTAKQQSEGAPRKSFEVQPAGYRQEASGGSEPRQANKEKIVDLPAGAEMLASALRLEAGMIVRGDTASRARIIVPSGGLNVIVDRLQFENVDFIWRAKADEIVSPEGYAIVNARAAQIRFAGCTFQAVSTRAQKLAAHLPVAIWVNSRVKSSISLAPAAQVQAERCVFNNLESAVQVNTRGPSAIVLRNCLCVATDSVVRFPEPMPVDAAATLAMENTTARAANSIVSLNCDATETGALSVTAVGCVFHTEEGGTLVSLRGPRTPLSANGILRAVEWTGEGSLLTPGTRIAIWRHDDIQEPLPEADLPFEGLITSELQFAAAASEDAGASRLTRWLGPMKSERNPGIDEHLPRLPAGKSE